MVGKARRAYFFWLAIIVKTKVVKEVAVLTTLSQVPTLLLGLMLAVCALALFGSTYTMSP